MDGWMGRNISVGIANGYELDGPGIESRWGGEIFRTCPDRHWGPPSLLYNGYRVFPGVKERPGRDADPLPPSSAVVMKGYSYTSTPPMDRTACTEPQCLYKGALYLFMYGWKTWFLTLTWKNTKGQPGYDSWYDVLEDWMVLWREQSIDYIIIHWNDSLGDFLLRVTDSLHTFLWKITD